MTRSIGARLGLVGAGLLVVLVTIAVAAPLIAPYDPVARSGPPFARPSGAHLLGTNDVGQDLLSELIFGARISLAVGIAAAVAATALGTAVGLVAGYARGWVDIVLMRSVDVVLSLPFLPLMLVVGVFLGPGLVTQILVIAGVMWAGAARQLRSQVLSARELDHVLAARSMGAGTGHVLIRHLLPAVGPLVVPQLVLATKTAILLEASLSFLGLGDPTAKSWGTTLFYANSRSAFLTDAWLWWIVPPGLGIAAAVLAFAFMGFALEERAQPALPRRVAAPSVRRVLRGSRRANRFSAEPAPGGPALSLEELSVAYTTGGDRVVAVDDVTFAVDAGEILGLVGESGSGKSTLATAVAGLLRPPATLLAGRVVVSGRDIATLPPDALRRLRGNRVALVPQQAMNALNPVFTIGDQLTEALRLHRDVTRRHARHRAGELLALVGIDPARSHAYPYQLSGGMRQRVVIAMALANEPGLLVADEPTTGLDVLVQAEILALLDDLRRCLDLAILVVSHDLPVILRLADRVAVMREGRIIEEAPAAQLSASPAHPYTQRLLDSTIRLPAPPARAVAAASAGGAP